MTPNEINLVKTFITTLEKNHDKIVELSIVESQNEVDKLNKTHEENLKSVREEWNKKLGDEEKAHLATREELNFLLKELQNKGYISDEIREKYGIVK